MEAKNNMISILSIAFSLFLLMDSIGNIPLYISVLKGVDIRRQRYVITREMLIALFIIILFSFIGNGLMRFLNVTHDTIQIAGGVILFLLCLKMIFPPPHEPRDLMPHDTEPLIVPLAVPLIAGPAVLAAVMIYSHQEINQLVMIGAIFIAWAASLLILLASSYLKNILRWRTEWIEHGCLAEEGHSRLGTVHVTQRFDPCKNARPVLSRERHGLFDSRLPIGWVNPKLEKSPFLALLECWDPFWFFASPNSTTHHKQ